MKQPSLGTRHSVQYSINQPPSENNDVRGLCAHWRQLWDIPAFINVKLKARDEKEDKEENRLSGKPETPRDDLCRTRTKPAKPVSIRARADMPV